MSCDRYTGVKCIDGKCPVINGYNLNCSDCWFNDGCETCAFYGTDICPRDILEKEQ